MLLLTFQTFNPYQTSTQVLTPSAKKKSLRNTCFISEVICRIEMQLKGNNAKSIKLGISTFINPHSIKYFSKRNAKIQTHII